jgi:hypothetical protein
VGKRETPERIFSSFEYALDKEHVVLGEEEEPRDDTYQF